MAAEKKAEPAAAEPPKQKGGKLVLLVVGVVVLAGAGVGGWLMFGRSHATAATAETKPKPEARAAAQYYKFDPAFVVNFGGEGNSRFLQVTVEAMSRDPAVIEQIKNNEPAIRNDLVLLYSSQQNDVLMSAEGKEKLRQSTLEAIRKTVAAEGGSAAAVENVYFTSFVIQ